ncbi:MAG TPA: serine--tRNA ligase [Spirochaetota bacterium]|nr:serine--tRNA ligase [Spirochaetota bacterium]HOM37837.1 serine--tRNA ligase [Spirochaetota bacterium]HPQ49286.1 serine--tRNA ligase [Spirochaetota bacterium]
MIDPKIIENNIYVLEESLKKRNIDISIIESIKKVSKDRREIIKNRETLLSKKNSLSKEFGERKRKGIDISDIEKEIIILNNELEKMDELAKNIELEYESIMLNIPNILSEDVPYGRSEEDNVEVKKWGQPRSFDFNPLPHWEIGKNLGILDIEVGTKLTGSRFYVLMGDGALLERALINFFLDFYSERGYKEVWPPYIVNSNTMTGTGQLPKFKDELFKIEGLDYYLIPTAEVPVTNIHSDQILSIDELPKYYCSFTACFRKEAGSYGKDTRGIMRVHQFSKVELVKIVEPSVSEEEHQKLLNDVEDALKKLGLPYRVILLCGGDTGFSASKCYDVEVWIPSENRYREISSVSNFRDFQARRAKIRYKKDGKNYLVHTLNGSGLAIGRTMIAIMENYQNKDGSITIPDALVPYMKGKKTIGG